MVKSKDSLVRTLEQQFKWQVRARIELSKMSTRCFLVLSRSNELELSKLL